MTALCKNISIPVSATNYQIDGVCVAEQWHIAITQNAMMGKVYWYAVTQTKSSTHMIKTAITTMGNWYAIYLNMRRIHIWRTAMKSPGFLFVKKQSCL
jgi:hypothetical protein